MQKAFRNILMIALLAIVLFGVFQFINGNGQSPKQLTYNEFMTKL
ncbi:ATP-dependent metallopeptidase FtsH/Yme1/Tma family protein, partial [Mammaliicoccus sciuri]